MNNKNGWIVKTLLGFLFLIIFTAVTTLASHTIANDNASRQRDSDIETEVRARDDEIKKEAIESERRIFKVLDDIKMEQYQKFTKILVAIERIEAKTIK